LGAAVRREGFGGGRENLSLAVCFRWMKEQEELIHSGTLATILLNIQRVLT
jgi:hypothetical protein